MERTIYSSNYQEALLSNAMHSDKKQSDWVLCLHSGLNHTLKCSMGNKVTKFLKVRLQRFFSHYFSFYRNVSKLLSVKGRY